LSTELTVGEALREASSFLLQHTPSLGRMLDVEQGAAARHEAEVLLCHALRISRTRLLTSLADELASEDWEAVWRGLTARANGIPLQYITGEAPFWGRMFHVRPGCLVPRPETEVLVEAALACLRQSALQAPDIVDLGTGSGAIAVTLALEAPQSQVHAVDVSADAIAIARDNAAQFGANVSFHLGDAFTVMRAGAVPRINLLVSNPPYIPSAEIARLDEEVRLHEPLGALDGGRDGLDFYRDLAKTAADWFRQGPAALMLEVGSGQAESVVALFQDEAGWDAFTFTIMPDLRGIGRVVQGLRAN
jgi:release factor glutamine methyltransferase